jgi:hypothetical protein
VPGRGQLLTPLGVLRLVLVQRELESQALSVSGLKGYGLRVPLLCDRFVG